jgi:hypothetical protein
MAIGRQPNTQYTLRVTKRSPIVLGLLLTLAVEPACHGLAAPEQPNPRHAPIYTDGPVPLPGEDFSIPHVTGIDGQPLVVSSVPPGSLMTFPWADARVPAEILIRNHADPLNAPADAQVWALDPILLPTPAGKHEGSIIGFEIPQLPHGSMTSGTSMASPTARAACSSIPAPLRPRSGRPWRSAPSCTRRNPSFTGSPVQSWTLQLGFMARCRTDNLLQLRSAASTKQCGWHRGNAPR